MSGWSPGLDWVQVLEGAPASFVRSLIGERLASLVELLSAGADHESRMRSVAAKVVDPDHVLASDAERDELLALLPTSKRTELAERLGMPSDADSAPYLKGLAWTSGQRRDALGFFGLVLDRSPTFLPLQHDCTPSYGLFPHQRDAANRVQALLYADPRRVLLHLPTGVGKTRTAMSLICQHLRQHEPTLVVWLAHGSELLDQAAAEFERAWSSLGDRPTPVRRLWGNGSPDLDDLRDGLVVLGLEKAASLDRSDSKVLHQLASRSTLTVFDEAHQAIAPTYRMVTDTLTINPRASLLGLTATPGRTWDDIDKDQVLSDYFFRQKVTLRIDGYSNPVTALIDQGYLSRPIFRSVASRSGIGLSAKDRAQLAKALDIPPQILGEVAQDEQWNLQVVTTVTELAQRHHRVLVFAASVQHCRVLAGVLSAMGHDADYVTGESPQRHRDQVIRRFKRVTGPPMILCNYGVLTTGFDAPAASATVIARPTKSLVLYSQMVGRVIRGPKAGGTPTCEVVTVVSPELPGFGDVAEAFTNWEDVWENA